MLGKAAPKCFSVVHLPRNTNQARGLAEFSIQFLKSAQPNTEVLTQLKRFHTDAVLCGLSALALNTNAPTVLRREALIYEAKEGAKCFGSYAMVRPEKAVLANCAAVRELDANGTVFGYSEQNPKHRAGEFGHNDFYSVAVAAAQINHLSGKETVLGMLLIDEIRGRLAEVYSLKAYKIDHVLHGAIASATVYGAMMGASALQIERAIGMVVSHYIPYRAIRAGTQLSDSKGAAAALAAETAVMSVHRCLNGFQGPEDVFRNPNSLFRVNESTTGDSPFDLELTHTGSDFAVMKMHFKLGVYEHQSAGAILAIILAIKEIGGLLELLIAFKHVQIDTYKNAYNIIGDPAKRNPQTRQSADHSMVYIISRILAKAFNQRELLDFSSVESLWKGLMLTPFDYSQEALQDPVTREIMQKVSVHHGGKEFDSQYPKGLPTRIQVTHGAGKWDSGLLLYPPGHSLCTEFAWEGILQHKFSFLSHLAIENPTGFIQRLEKIEELTPEELQSVYECSIKNKPLN